MYKSKFTIAILFLSVTVLLANGQAGPVASQSTDLSRLSWITGNWSGVQNGVEMEEVWLAPKGNTMLGLHRDVKGVRTLSFEFLRIEAKADGITYWASPQGRAATPFRLAEVRDNYVVFENPEHDFPRKVIYWLADGALHAKIEGMLNGKPASEEWVWKEG